MKTEQVIEGNKLIAEFMGFKENSTIGVTVLYNEVSCEVLDETKLSYHTSWDWLMPVVEKIENVYTKKYKSGFIVRIEYKDIFVMTLDTSEELIICDQSDSKLEGVYWTCVKFIKWYNKNK